MKALLKSVSPDSSCVTLLDFSVSKHLNNQTFTVLNVCTQCTQLGLYGRKEHDFLILSAVLTGQISRRIASSMNHLRANHMFILFRMSPCGFQPPTFRYSAERDNPLRNKDEVNVQCA